MMGTIKIIVLWPTSIEVEILIIEVYFKYCTLIVGSVILWRHRRGIEIVKRRYLNVVPKYIHGIILQVSY